MSQPDRHGSRRFPLEPLEHYLKTLHLVETDLQLALLCQVTRRAVTRWRGTGLTLARADAVATGLGVHPSWIWGDTWWKEETDDNADGDGPAPASPAQRSA